MVLALCGVAIPGSAAPLVFDRWLTADHDGVIEIGPCGGDLCGRIVGMDRPHRRDGGPALDAHGKPMCGLRILTAHAVADGRWEGVITDPTDGTDWNCTLRLTATGALRLRGYILVPLIGASQTWTRYAGRLGPDCTML